MAAISGYAGISLFIVVMLGGLPTMASTYALLAWWVWRTSRLSAPLWSRLALPSAWAAGYVFACQFAIVAALEAHAQLPKTKPPDDCDVATAAARGHAKVVGVERVLVVGRGRMAINAQLRHLKCGEIALQTMFPAAHRRCRWIYDRVGPKLASKMRHPVLSDVAYLSLKPLEWLVRRDFVCVAGKPREVVGAEDLWIGRVAPWRKPNTQGNCICHNY